MLDAVADGSMLVLLLLLLVVVLMLLLLPVGVERLVRLHKQDLCAVDMDWLEEVRSKCILVGRRHLTDGVVVTVFLLPTGLEKLKGQLLRLVEAGVTVVSFKWNVPHWVGTPPVEGEGYFVYRNNVQSFEHELKYSPDQTDRVNLCYM